MKHANQAMALGIASAALIAAVAIVSAIHISLVAVRFTENN